jgi:oxygen-dependent protoporphyrinogen oxidase
MAVVVVVGGGIAGLTAALDLTTAGHSVTVLDGADRPGGKLRAAQLAGTAIDVGAESALAVRPEFSDLVTAVGLGDRLTTPATTSASVWSRGALHPLPRGTLMGVPSDPDSALGILTEDEVGRLRAEPAGVPLDGDGTVGGLVADRLGPAVVDRLVEPLLGGVYAGSANALSLRATTPQLWAAVAGGGSLLEAARAAAGRAAGSTRSAFVGLRGGIASVVPALVASIEAAGGSVRSGVIVRGLAADAVDGWRVTAGPTNDVEVTVADAVVVAVPPAPAARLLAGVAPEASRLLAGVESASMAILSYAFEADAVGQLPGSGVLVPPVEGLSIKASTFSSGKWRWLAEAAPGTCHLRASIGRAGETSALQRGDDELLDLARRELGSILGRRLPEPLDAHVQRWGGALPQYAVGHVDRVAAIRRDVGTRPGLAVTGAAYDGVGIPAVVASAHTAADLVLDHLDRTTARNAPKEHSTS